MEGAIPHVMEVTSRGDMNYRALDSFTEWITPLFNYEQYKHV